MVYKAGQTCLVRCCLTNGRNTKIIDVYELQVNESTRVKDLYDYVEGKYNLQSDSFNLRLMLVGAWINLSEMKDKTMSEIGVDFSYDQDTTAKKDTFLITDSNDTMEQAKPSVSYQASVWGEDNEDIKHFIKSETSYVGLVNQAMTCYLNSLLQALYMTPEFRNALYNWEYVDGLEKDEANSIPYQLQKLFLNLQTSTKSAVETTALTKSFGWDSTEAWQQHDIQELCRVMFDALEQKFKNTEQADLINRFYEGKMTDYVKCLECGTEKSREDTFLDIPLPVRSFGSNVTYNSVEEALRAFVQYETLEGNNQYHCEKCNKKCDAHKGLKFTKFPYLLTLHLKRFDFDFKTFHRIKLNDKVTFPDILNLNPFISLKINQESPGGDENICLVKCDDSSTTDSGTLDDDYPPCENSLPNSNRSTNEDPDDDEGIDISSGPSNSNCTVNNHENEKNRDNGSVKGPYQYELFSIMIHSGSASGGHYYAYIKDFRTQEWYSFNDQNVTQITHEDIQKTYGGSSSRPYYSSAYSSTTAYMLMYRQIDPARNTLPMQVKDFPKHIQELLKKMKEHEDNGRKCRVEYLTGPDIEVFCRHPATNETTVGKFMYCANTTWAEITKEYYENFRLEDFVSLDQCRLVSYDQKNDFIICSYEGRENEIFQCSRRMNTFLLEIRDKDKKFEPYLRGIVTKVFVVDTTKKKIVEGPVVVRGIRAQTVKEYKQTVGKIVNINPDEMKLVLRKHDTDTILVENDDADLQTAQFSNEVTVFVLTVIEDKSLYNTVINDIIQISENIITLCVNLPDMSKEILEDLNIPTLEEKYKEKEKSITSSPSKANVKESQSDAALKGNEVPKTGKNSEDVPVKNMDLHLVENEEWNTPLQSNSEDSSLSDSEENSFRDALDAYYDPPYLSSSTNISSINLLNPTGVENTENASDDNEYYFKATPSSNTNQKSLKVVVDSRMRYYTFKKKLEPHVGVPTDYFKILGYIEDIEEAECNDILKQLSYDGGEKLYVKLSRILRKDEFTVKLYQFLTYSPQPYNFLFEWIISKDMTVGQVKKEILAEIKRKFDRDIPFERCRLRKKEFRIASKVFLDDQKFRDFRFYTQWDLFIQELPDKEPVTDSNQIVIFVRRWYPSQMQLGPFQEIVMDGKSIKVMREKISAISDIPVEHVEVASAKGYVPHNLPILRIQKESIWYGHEGWFVNVEDGCVMLYKDNRETLKNLSCEELNENMLKGVIRYFPNSSERKEKALKIHTDAK